ncbi:hypothetical protein DFJ77DRAFT_433925, partial [Powellomyces hirtus]
VITGCSTGIGRAAAIHLVNNGFVVFGGVRNEKDGEALRLLNIQPLILDVTQPEHIVQSVETVTSYLREHTAASLAALVNNAGVCEASAFEKLDRGRVQGVLGVNLVGVMDVTRAFLPLIRQHRGRILVVGSMHGRLSWAGWSVYSASKWGIKGWTLSLKQELEPLGVSVSLIEAGLTKTEAGAKSMDSLKDNRSGPLTVYTGLEQLTESFVGPDSDASAALAETTTNLSIAHAIMSQYPRAMYLPSWACVFGAVFAALPASLAPIGLLIRGYRINRGMQNGWTSDTGSQHGGKEDHVD